MARVKKISAAGKPANIWVPPNGKAPNQWKHSEIPKSPGEYQLIFTDNCGQPIQFPLRNDLNWDANTQKRMESAAKTLQGVIYCGMTTCLYCRFWQLVKSWTNQPPKELHDSRKTWDKDPKLQQIYTPANILCRFRCISTIKWHLKRSKKVQEIFEVYWPDVGTNHTHLSAAAAITAETFSLLKWEKCFGKPNPHNLPPLNLEQAERLGDVVTDQWLEQLFISDKCFDDEKE